MIENIMNTLTTTGLLDLSYRDLALMNATAATTDPQLSRKKYTEILKTDESIKAVTVCFSDIEGRLYMLDYDKKFFLKSTDSLTFDGSSVPGFTDQQDSDLKLHPDWSSFTFVPADIFGSGKVIMFANITFRDGTPHPSDFRGRLQAYTTSLLRDEGIELFMAPEIEGFLLQGVDAEQNYSNITGFTLASSGGYLHSLPLDELRRFIDKTAEVQRAMGFGNEKDHPEAAPSQFEINFAYASAIKACDRTLLYKLICRQVAMHMGMTASFLPKPIQGIAGSGMHINISFFKKDQNLFYDKKSKGGLSPYGRLIAEKILHYAPELCLLFNPSVNAYRRLDPLFEAPNQIKISANDRGSMIRIPYATEKSTRIEIRSVSPDANPYLILYAITKAGLKGTTPLIDTTKRPRIRFLPSTLHDAIRVYKASDSITMLIGEDSKQRYLNTKQAVADRSARDLGTRIKEEEILYHHEITNQHLWNRF